MKIMFLTFLLVCQGNSSADHNKNVDVRFGLEYLISPALVLEIDKKWELAFGLEPRVSYIWEKKYKRRRGFYFSLGTGFLEAIPGTWIQLGGDIEYGEHVDDTLIPWSISAGALFKLSESVELKLGVSGIFDLIIREWSDGEQEVFIYPFALPDIGFRFF